MITQPQGTKFYVTVVDDETRNKIFAIDKKKYTVLNLKRGYTYYFKIDQEANNDGKYQHYLYFTEDPLGGQQDGGYPRKIMGFPDPIGNGTVSIRIDNKTPKYFYYQCSLHKNMGGLIIVHEPNVKY